MSNDRPNLLPKGIVVNAPHIEQSLERKAGEPVNGDDIERMWKVYTTTQRRLLDPTAIRLEQFWWRIWGSNRRQLNASTVASIYAHISHGETFMPLRGPSNRDESGPQTPNTANTDGGSSNARPTMAQGDSRPSTTSSVSTSKIPAVSPLPPILKKADAPPPSGPRPSVGFASPASSDIEADDVVEASSISTNSHGIVDPASADPQISKPEKKGKKKSQAFIASTRKKRPTMVRRTSSKSSAEFKSGLPLSNVTSPSMETPPPLALLPKGKGKEKAVTISKFQENFSVSPEKVLKKPKAPKSPHGKVRPKTKESQEPLVESHINDDDYPASLHRIENRNSISNGDPGPSTVRNMQTMQTDIAKEDMSVAEAEDLEMQKVLLHDFKRQKREKERVETGEHSIGLEQVSTCDDSDLEISPSFRPPKNSAVNVSEEVVDTQLPSRSEGSFPPANTHRAPRDVEEERNAKERSERPTIRAQTDAGGHYEHSSKASTRSQPLKSKSSTTISQNLAPATGQLDIGTTDTRPSNIPHNTDKHKGAGKMDEMFAKRPIPSLPTGTSALSASVPSMMARSKSQLSLLLEKDRVRSGEREKDKDGRKKKKEINR